TLKRTPLGRRAARLPLAARRCRAASLRHPPGGAVAFVDVDAAAARPAPTSSTAAAIQDGATKDPPRPAIHPAIAGPMIWPVLNATVIRAIVSSGRSGASDRACARPSAVIAMKVPPSSAAPT